MSYSTFNGSYHYTPSYYHQPNNIKELRSIINSSPEPFHAFSGYHTFNDIALAPTMINMNRFKEIELIGDYKVRVGAGVKIEELITFLRPRGLTLAIFPSVSTISVVGALCTGTHGSSWRWGSFCELLLAIELLDVFGNDITIRKGEDLFPAFQCSLGLLGIIHHVILQCVPSFRLKQKIINDFEWNPEIIELYLTRYPYSQMERVADSSKYILTLRKASENEAYPYYEDVLTSTISPSPYNEMELAYHWKEIGNHDFFILPGGYQKLRFGAPGESLLSMNAGRATLYVSTYQTPSLEGQIKLLEYGKPLIERYYARPHYSKIHQLDALTMWLLYGSNFLRFKEIKERMDPLDRCSNNFSLRILKWK